MTSDQYAPLSDRITAAIKAISPQPVKFVVNTHWHGDHTGGNENLGKAGVVIVAHDNVYGVQFHPEKSSGDGLTLLRNFVRLCGGAAGEAAPVGWAGSASP